MSPTGRSLEQIRKPFIGEVFIWKAIGFSPGEVASWHWFIESRNGSKFSWERLENDGLSILVQPVFANKRFRTVIHLENGGEIENTSWPALLRTDYDDALNPRSLREVRGEIERQSRLVRKDLARIQNERGLIWKAQKIEDKIATNEAVLAQIKAEKDAIWMIQDAPNQLAELEKQRATLENDARKLAKERERVSASERALEQKRQVLQIELQKQKQKLANDARIGQEEVARQLANATLKMEEINRIQKQLEDDHNLQLKLAEISEVRREILILKEELEGELDNMIRGMSKVWSRMEDTAKGEVLKVLNREKRKQAEARAMQMNARRVLDIGVEICGSCNGPVTRCDC